MIALEMIPWSNALVIVTAIVAALLAFKWLFID